ncbi:MAG TPA: exosome complex RNA-binding protein Csl4 [Methermicoccus shengliensis]|uniref:Exosome complex component Csl4 n=2 Tax=Methermicoccus shengliensis TaxID=660064 RepID=A0A832VZM7_9EURY|nr:exosome complex RNA-binding protein Csl4 [Methermicoccus shengliensis]
MSEEPFREIVERPEELKDAPFVLPGDRIGSAEEYLPGSGTYEHMGGIYAAVAGRPYYDREQRYTKVFPEMNAPHRIREGDIVIGEVTDIKGSMVMVSIVCLDDMGEREIPNLQPAVIHVSNVKDSYVKELSSEFGYGDIIKARVIDSKNMRLSTEGPELGVLKARCQRCRVPARLEGERLVCPSCGAMLKRKLASGFAQGLLKR